MAFLGARARCLAAALLLASLSPVYLDATEGSPTRPNILLFLADDMAWHDCGAYGNKQVRTPHIDRLATEGMIFDRAFTATAMCAPTRQQLYTGIFPVRNGAYPNHSQVKAGTKSMVHHLRTLGYRVGLIGKRHFGPNQSFPFDYPKTGKSTQGLSETVRSYIEKDRTQAWCLVVASRHPHAPWDQSHSYDPDQLTLPPYLLDNPETRRALANYYGEITALDQQLGGCMAQIDAAGQTENTILIFTSEQGPQFPGAKWTCYDLGLRAAFIVRWPARIRAGSKTDAMIQYVDVLPTLIEAAGGDPTEFDTSCPDAYGHRGFDGKSFLGVLLGQNAHHRDYVYGVHTTLGIIAGKPYPIRSIRDEKYKYIVNLMPQAVFQNVVTEQDRQGYWRAWKRDAAHKPLAKKLVQRYRRRPAEEFYDVLADPFELNNLAGDPASREIMDVMRAKLQAWMNQQGDQGVETELKAKMKKDEAQ
ncbi:sulfatase [Acidobacteria bacterium AH-259-A15]|nr:sulfatase [Acidobacteria bacterium AH-259-A15]